MRNKARVEAGDYKITRIKFNQTAVKVVDITASASLDDAFAYHKHDPDFLLTPAVTVYQRLLTVERPDLFEAFRVACELPADIQEINLPRPKRPPYEEAVEFVVSFIPICGLAGRRLRVRQWREPVRARSRPTSSEASWRPACCCLGQPASSRLVNRSTPLSVWLRFTAKTHSGHSYVLVMGERLSSDVVGWAKLRDAQKAIAKGGKITRGAASELSETLRRSSRMLATPDPKGLILPSRRPLRCWWPRTLDLPNWRCACR